MIRPYRLPSGVSSYVSVTQSHLYITVNHIVVVAVSKCLQNLPHVVTRWAENRNRQGEDHLGRPQIVYFKFYSYFKMSYLATASLYTNPASALFTISKHRSAPSILSDGERERKKRSGW